MRVFDRVGKMVQAEWHHRFGRNDPAPSTMTTRTAEAASHQGPGDARDLPHTARPRGSPDMLDRRPVVADVDAALRALELAGRPTLAEVRARYRLLAQRIHPKTGSSSADEAHAARVVVETLTDALEVLEEHLLPLPE